jgi:hypothetical protein
MLDADVKVHMYVKLSQKLPTKFDQFFGKIEHV